MSKEEKIIARLIEENNIKENGQPQTKTEKAKSKMVTQPETTTKDTVERNTRAMEQVETPRAYATQLKADVGEGITIHADDHVGNKVHKLEENVEANTKKVIDEGPETKTIIVPEPEQVSSKGEVLTNAIGFTKEYSDGEWLAFEGNDAEFIIDLEDEVIIKKVSMNFHNKVNDWIHHSNDVTLLGSLDGKSFSVLGAKKIEDIDRPIVNVAIDLAFDNPLSKARYIKVVAKNQIIPFGFSGEGNPAWLFIDEVVVE